MGGEREVRRTNGTAPASGPGRPTPQPSAQRRWDAGGGPRQPFLTSAVHTFGPGSFSVEGTVLCTVGCGVASPPPTHQMPTPSSDNHKCLQTSPNVPWVPALLQVRTAEPEAKSRTEVLVFSQQTLPERLPFAGHRAGARDRRDESGRKTCSRGEVTSCGFSPAPHGGRGGVRELETVSVTSPVLVPRAGIGTSAPEPHPACFPLTGVQGRPCTLRPSLSMVVCRGSQSPSQTNLLWDLWPVLRRRACLSAPAVPWDNRGDPYKTPMLMLDATLPVSVFIRPMWGRCGCQKSSHLTQEGLFPLWNFSSIPPSLFPHLSGASRNVISVSLVHFVVVVAIEAVIHPSPAAKVAGRFLIPSTRFQYTARVQKPCLRKGISQWFSERGPEPVASPRNLLENSDSWAPSQIC